MIKEWIIAPIGDGLWRVEIIVAADVINSIKDVIEELDKVGSAIEQDE